MFTRVILPLLFYIFLLILHYSSLKYSPEVAAKLLLYDVFAIYIAKSNEGDILQFFSYLINRKYIKV